MQLVEDHGVEVARTDAARRGATAAAPPARAWSAGCRAAAGAGAPARCTDVSPVRVSMRMGKPICCDRRQQVAGDVDGQRLERRNVERVQAGALLARACACDSATGSAGSRPASCRRRSGRSAGSSGAAPPARAARADAPAAASRAPRTSRERPAAAAGDRLAPARTEARGSAWRSKLERLVLPHGIGLKRLRAVAAAEAMLMPNRAPMRRQARRQPHGPTPIPRRERHRHHDPAGPAVDRGRHRVLGARHHARSTSSERLQHAAAATSTIWASTPSTGPSSYFLLGAVVVVPIWFIVRLMKPARSRTRRRRPAHHPSAAWRPSPRRGAPANR